MNEDTEIFSDSEKDKISAYKAPKKFAQIVLINDVGGVKLYLKKSARHPWAGDAPIENPNDVIILKGDPSVIDLIFEDLKKKHGDNYYRIISNLSTKYQTYPHREFIEELTEPRRKNGKTPVFNVNSIGKRFVCQFNKNYIEVKCIGENEFLLIRVDSVPPVLDHPYLTDISNIEMHKKLIAKCDKSDAGYSYNHGPNVTSHTFTSLSQCANICANSPLDGQIVFFEKGTNKTYRDVQ
jgi:hypothetical protein